MKSNLVAIKVQKKTTAAAREHWALMFRPGGEGGDGDLSNEVDCEQRPEHVVRPQ